MEEDLTEQFLQELEEFEEDIGQQNQPDDDSSSDNNSETNNLDQETLDFLKKALGDGTQDYIKKQKEDLESDGLHESTLAKINEFQSNQTNTKLNDDQEAQLIIDAHNLITKITTSVRALHIFLMYVYSDKFPGLETLVTTPVEFSKCIIRIGLKRNISDVDLGDILSNHVIVAIKMASSTNSEAEISSKNLDMCIRGAEYLLEIVESNQKLINFVESRMLKIAPNLSALVGTQCAA